MTLKDLKDAVRDSAHGIKIIVLNSLGILKKMIKTSSQTLVPILTPCICTIVVKMVHADKSLTLRTLKLSANLSWDAQYQLHITALLENVPDLLRNV